MNKEQVDFKESLSYFLEPCNYTLSKYTKGRLSIAGGMQESWYSITPLLDEEQSNPFVSDLLFYKRERVWGGTTVELHAGDFFENPHVPTEEEVELFLLTNKDIADFIVYCRNLQHKC